MAKSSAILYADLVEKAAAAPLSELLPMLLLLARRIGNKGLEKWVRLELNGYYDDNPAMGEDVRIPDYRLVPGRHSDDYGRILRVSDPNLAFVNTVPLPNGIAELERLSRGTSDLVLNSPVHSEILRDGLKVEMTKFVFNPVAILGILDSVRSRCVDWLHDIESSFDDHEVGNVAQGSTHNAIIQTHQRKRFTPRILLEWTFSAVTSILLVVVAASVIIDMHQGSFPRLEKLLGTNNSLVQAGVVVLIAALPSTLLVLILRSVKGDLDFSAFGIKFKGPAAPILLWVVSFLAISAVVLSVLGIKP